MTMPTWPDDFDALEAALAERARGEPSPALRSRVLGAVADELARRQRGGWWWYVGAAAALAVLWANVSWTACRQTTFDWRGPQVDDGLADKTRAIEELVPGISPREARREALVLRGIAMSGGTPPLAPLPAPAGRALIDRF